MNSQRYIQVKKLFQEAIDLPQSQRETFVIRNCDDPSVQSEVLQLCENHEDDQFLNSPVVDTPSNPRPVSPEEQNWSDVLLGKVVGDFTLIERIGTGGMGVVYRAQQTKPSRSVAVKALLPKGEVEPDQLRRFLHESEILGQLHHPGIVRIYSAGNADLGFGTQPWFAMELVEGKTLSDFYTNDLSTRQKLELILQILDAVQYANEKGVIHRDLKPANVLIANEDAGGVPTVKIVDFGVARVLTSDAAITAQTSSGDIIGTLKYMSPEQLRGDRDAIDPRADVFAVGVIGYELLAGRLPHVPNNSTVAEYLRCREVDDPPLLGTIDARLRGDLEAIFSQAIATDIDHRYCSAADFAADIRNFLNNRPVGARRPSTMNRLKKYVARNRALVGGTAATCLASLVGIVGFSVVANQARQEATRANYEATKTVAVNEFLTNHFMMKLIAAAHESGDATERLPLEELISKAGENISQVYGAQGETEAAVRSELGTLYYNAGLIDQALLQYQRARVLYQETIGTEHYDSFETLNNIGLCHLRRGRSDQAEEFFRSALAGQIRTGAGSDKRSLQTMCNLAVVLHGAAEKGSDSAEARLDEAEVLFRKAIALRSAEVGTEDQDCLTYMAGLGSLLIDRDRIGEAEELHGEVYEEMSSLLGKNHITSLVAGSRYGQTLYKNKNFDHALAVLEPVLGGILNVRGEDHPDVYIVRRLLSRVHRELGDLNAAKYQLEQAEQAASQHPDRNAYILNRVQRDLKSLEE